MSLNHIAMELISFFSLGKNIRVFFYEQYQFGVTKRYLKKWVYFDFSSEIIMFWYYIYI